MPDPSSLILAALVAMSASTWVDAHHTRMVILNEYIHRHIINLLFMLTFIPGLFFLVHLSFINLTDAQMFSACWVYF